MKFETSLLLCTNVRFSKSNERRTHEFEQVNLPQLCNWRHCNAGIGIVVGGALLDIVGFVIGFIALTSAKKMIAAMPGDAYVENVLKLAKIAVVVSLVAFIANILTAVFLTPVLVDQASSMVAKSASTF